MHIFDLFLVIVTNSFTNINRFNMFEFKNQINNHYCYIRNTKHWIDAGLELTKFDNWIKNNKNLMV